MLVDAVIGPAGDVLAAAGGVLQTDASAQIDDS